MKVDEGLVRLRIDKWLWAARFFKTRGLATEAVEGGRAQLNGQRVKPAKEVKQGDSLQIVAGEQQWTVVVRGINARRGPALVARLMYEETPESVAARIASLETRKIAAEPATAIHGRPTKRDRRQLDRLG
jgi:ribosome-associated heat shock protein Hsp15